LRTMTVASLTLTWILAASGVEAQDPIQQTVVVTAAATPIALGSAIRTVAVLTRDQIRALPVHSVADALRLVASVDVRSRGERGVQTDFTVRGAGFGEMLVLVDGVRLNDPQSGHHNGDIPVPLESIDRIGVLLGPGSSLFGADALGGAINIITRRDDVPTSGSIEVGSFGYVGGRGQADVAGRTLRQTVSVSVERSDGFTFARDFARVVARSDLSIGQRTRVSASFLGNDFGANGFYGPSPSHEWTNQTLVAADRRLGTVAGWRLDGTGSYRTHGDRFLWDVRVPGILENRHRTHAVLGSLKGSRRLGPKATVVTGIESGADWIRSTNLGDHEVQRVSAFGEWRQALGTRTEVEASLRADRYTEFGGSWNPGFGAGWWATSSVRLRGSTGRAFRVPTFTERYYSDPAHLARADLQPERAWSRDFGADLFLQT
jgi:outer membrane cobalamin receptor